MNAIQTIKTIDEGFILFFRRYGHLLHRVSLGLLYVWFGLLKPFGHPTTSALLARSIYWGNPDTIVVLLGWWEVAIGICLIIRPLVRLAVILLFIRIPGILLAFVFEPEILFFHFPLAPTPEGQYLIKDLALFFATLAIAGSLREKSTRDKYH